MGENVVKISLNQGITDDLQDRNLWRIFVVFFKMEDKGTQIKLQGCGEGDTGGKDYSFEKFGSEKESKGMLTRIFCEIN